MLGEDGSAGKSVVNLRRLRLRRRRSRVDRSTSAAGKSYMSLFGDSSLD